MCAESHLYLPWLILRPLSAYTLHSLPPQLKHTVPWTSLVCSCQVLYGIRHALCCYLSFCVRLLCCLRSGASWGRLQDLMQLRVLAVIGSV